MMKTYMAKPGTVEQRWWIVDAEDQIVGRLAAKLAPILMGKHRPTYTPHIDTGDFIVVKNAEKVQFTGRKWETKTYESYSGYPGGLRERTASQMRDNKPEEILREAVRRMLPKGTLGRKMLSKLKVYAGQSHPHQAQDPQPLEC